MWKGSVSVLHVNMWRSNSPGMTIYETESMRLSSRCHTLAQSDHPTLLSVSWIHVVIQT